MRYNNNNSNNKKILITRNNKSKFIFIQQVVCSLPLNNQLLQRAGIQARPLICLYVLFTWAAIQTGP